MAVDTALTAKSAEDGNAYSHCNKSRGGRTDMISGAKYTGEALISDTLLCMGPYFACCISQERVDVF